MSVLVSTILTNVRLRYSDLTDAQGLIYMQQTLSMIRGRLRLKSATITNTSLVADTADYAYSELAKGVDQVRYRISATADDFVILEPVTMEWLYANYPEWRKMDSDQPQMFAIDSNATGPYLKLIPAPATSTSGGYPRLEIDIAQDEVLTTGTTLYDDLPNQDAYTTGVKWRFAQDNHRDDAEYWRKEHEVALREAQAYLQNKNRRASTQMLPQVMGNRMGVR